MALLGFDAVGRLAVGQFEESYAIGTGNLTQAAGAGVAGSLSGTTGAGSSVGRAAGIGIAGSFAATLTAKITAVAYSGRAGSIATTNTLGISQAAGVGAAGSITSLVQAYGIIYDIILTITDPAWSIISAPTPNGVFNAVGVGVAGTVGEMSTTPLVRAVSSSGMAGTITGSSSGFALPSAVGVGVVGRITIVVSGGGGAGSSGSGTGGSKRPINYRTGLEPIKKIAPPPPKPKPVPLPPEWAVRVRKPPPAPKYPGEPDSNPAVASEVMQIARAMAKAREKSPEQQDADDIADVQAYLALID